MALRLKTIEYGFLENEATLALATRFNFAAETLYIPETTSRTFRSVILQVTMNDGATVATSLTSWLLGIKLGAVAFSDVTVTDTITNSGENQTWLFTRDVTSYFNTNFGAGASQTCQVGVQFGASATANITAKLIITYESEEQQTRVKTVKIPLESATGALTTSLVSIGTDQVPNLDAFLPESTKVYRRIWFECSGNQGATGTTDASLRLALDAEGVDNDAVHEGALASGVWHYRQWQRNAITTNATHDFKASVSSTVGFTMNHMSIVLCVTYEYDHTNSTTIINSIQLPLMTMQPMGRTVDGDQSVITQKFYIEEPSTITLVQSGVYLAWSSDGGAIGLNVGVGSQVDRAYTTAGATVCGQYSVIQRIDSGGAQGAGITLARGLNTLNVEVHSTNASLNGVVSGLLYLNYTSGKATDGDGTHNHTVMMALLDHAADVIQREATAQAFNVPEASYYVNNIGFKMQNIEHIGNFATNGIILVAERLSGEMSADGWEDIFSIPSTYSDNENGCYEHFIDASDKFDRYPNEQQDRLAIETARKYRIYASTTGPTSIIYPNLLAIMTYHSITVTKSGTITGSSGGTVDIGFWRIVSGINERLDTTSRSGNGSFSITWYDDTENVFAEAKESSTLLGRSDTGAT